jgi:hypothetical protein
MGAAFFRVNDATDTVLSFSKIDEGGVCQSSAEAFHCWVETQYHVIDFTAPVYQKYFDKMKMNITLPSKMFQKKKDAMASSWQELYSEGDYFVYGDEGLTKHFYGKALETRAIEDLANICFRWFTPPPRKIEKSMKMMNDLGELIEVRLTTMPIVGVW